MDILGTNLAKLDWTVLDLLNDVNTAWSMLYKGMMVEVEKLCPYKEFRVRKNKPIWFTGELSSLGRERDIILRNYRRGGSTNNNLYNELVTKRKDFNRLVRAAKSNFYNDQILHSRGDPKNFWNLFGDLLGSEQTKEIDCVFIPGSEILCGVDETVTIINNFFANIGKNNNINGVNYTSQNQLDPTPDETMENFCKMDSITLINILKELNKSKSSGIEEINSTIIFDAIHSIHEIFVKVINLSLETGVFPESWKTARIAVLPKKADCRKLDNLRPISILPILGKIIEKHVKKQLVEYFEFNSLFYKFQFGFQSGKSIQDAIFALTNVIFNARNKGHHTAAAFLVQSLQLSRSLHFT